jgi:hypothetical protein
VKGRTARDQTNVAAGRRCLSLSSPTLNAALITTKRLRQDMLD